VSNQSESDNKRFSWRIDEMREELSRRDPLILANNTATIYHDFEEENIFSLSLWGQGVTLTCPEFIACHGDSGKDLDMLSQAMILYYYRTANGRPLSEKWISFSELPDGRFYNQAFQGYTGKELVRHFQDDQNGFELAAERLNGIKQSLGDASYSFQALPRVNLLVVFWKGDEDFPSSFQLLFDASASYYLPTDAYAILGSTLTRHLIKASNTDN